MSKILLAGSGGTPTENVVKSLLHSTNDYELIGMGSELFDLIQSDVERKYLVPYSNASDYDKHLLNLLIKEKPEIVHFQNDVEILHASSIRDKILSTGTKLFMPRHSTIENCVNKWKSYLIWKNTNLPVPETVLINDTDNLKMAFKLLGNQDGTIWLREVIGGGAKGALPTNNYEFAKLWIDRHNGWGRFTAAELLTPDSVTWLSIWYEGELVVAQTRKRIAWNFGNRTLSGVTGITGVGMTVSDEKVTEIAINGILAIDSKPHGVFGVDMTYDEKGVPKLTEINVSRFFTTVYFFTKAGLNLPEIFFDLALKGKKPTLSKIINPLPDGLLWIRSMDKEPLLTTLDDVLGRVIQSDSDGNFL
jgi:carbamoyl-phosphate synthase large subunit